MDSEEKSTQAIRLSPNQGLKHQPKAMGTQSSKQIFQQAEALPPLPGGRSHHADGPSIEWNTSSTTALEQYVQLHEQQGKQEHLCQVSAFPSHQPSQNSHSGPLVLLLATHSL